MFGLLVCVVLPKISTVLKDNRWISQNKTIEFCYVFPVAHAWWRTIVVLGVFVPISDKKLAPTRITRSNYNNC